MFLIIKNIPSTINKYDLEKLIKPSLEGRFWQKSGSLKSVKIIEVSYDDKPLEYHGVAFVTPDDVAMRVINSLNGKTAFGVLLNVHEYEVRNWQNDRRQRNELPAKGLKSDKRKRDRRRSGIRIN